MLSCTEQCLLVYSIRRDISPAFFFSVLSPQSPHTRSSIMQFKKLAFVASLVTLAVATPTPNAADESCSTGSLQCCSSVESASDPVVSTLLGLLGIVLGALDINVGVTCSPITVSNTRSI